MKNKIDISIVMTLHKEGLLAKYSLDSLTHNRLAASKNRLRTQLICVLDSADRDTKNIVMSHRVMTSEDKILEVNNKDLPSSRNDGIAQATGDCVSIVDGDDYYSKDWLVNAHKELQSFPTAIVHPQWVVHFDSIHCLGKVIDQRQVNYPMASLLKHHPWIATSFAKRKIYADTPYVATRYAESGFAYEDWQWNITTLARGHMHIVAADTALFYRRKATGSMLSEQVSARGIIRPSEFFNKSDLWDQAFGIYK